MRLLFKILPDAEWRAAETAGRFTGSAIDHQDGFIHLSPAHQVRETAARHFKDRDGLVLVAFDEAALSPLKWEASRGGDLFPHIYGPLPLSAITETVPLPLVQGVHQFPEGLPE